MPFATPTLRQTIERIVSDLDARFPDADARLPTSNLNVLGYVDGAAVQGLYGYLDYLSLQLMQDTCEDEYLVRHAAVIDMTQIAAEEAYGSVIFTGITGAVIPAYTQLARSDGALYKTTAIGTLVSGTATIPVEAVVAGAAGNMPSGTLSLVSPIADVSGTATVTGGIVGGADIETMAAFRARVLDRLRHPPEGGAEHDYVTWAKEIAGVTRAWCYPLAMGIGTVVIRFVRDNDASLIPDSGEVAAVQAYIDARRPVTAAVTVVAPVAVPLAFTITGLDPDNANIRAAVEAELADLLAREAEPGGTILLSHIRAAISGALGENNHTLTTPAANVTHSAGQIATMGAVTWV